MGGRGELAFTLTLRFPLVTGLIGLHSKQGCFYVENELGSRSSLVRISLQERRGLVFVMSETLALSRMGGG